MQKPRAGFPTTIKAVFKQFSQDKARAAFADQNGSYYWFSLRGLEDFGAIQKLRADQIYTLKIQLYKREIRDAVGTRIREELNAAIKDIEEVQ